jgi:SAP domain-containing protein
MALQIDPDHKYTEEERRYLLARGRRHLVLQNDRRFPDKAASSPAPQGSKTPEQEEWEAQVNELTVAELRDELANRNLDTKGNQDTLRKRLIETGPES